jgi:hypothetical protein
MYLNVFTKPFVLYLKDLSDILANSRSKEPLRDISRERENE